MERQSIIDGMPTLLASQIRNGFDKNWPFNKELPVLINKSDQNPLEFEQFDLLNLIAQYNEQTESQQKSRGQKKFLLRKTMKITDCPHQNRKHYAKNMCSVCYHKKINEKKVLACEHSQRVVFARNMCLQCYTRAYRASKKQQ